MPRYLVTVAGRTFVREGLPAVVVQDERGHKSIAVKAADPRDQAERRLMTSLAELFQSLAPKIAARLARGEMPSDQELNDALGRVLEPRLAEVATAEFERLGLEVGVQFDPAMANQFMADWARRYTFDLVRSLTETTRKTLQSAVARFGETPGMTRGELEALLEPAFGKVRAEAIAVTEVTRGSSAAMDRYQAEMSGQGLDFEQVYHTSRDERVCPICSPDNGKPESEWGERGKPPRHSRCRCFTTLRLAPDTKSADLDGAKFNPYHDRLGRFASRGSAGGAGGMGGMKREVEAYLSKLPEVGGKRYLDVDDGISLGQIVDRHMTAALAPYDRLVTRAQKRREDAEIKIMTADFSKLSEEQAYRLRVACAHSNSVLLRAEMKRDAVREGLMREALSNVRPMGLPKDGIAYADKQPKDAQEKALRDTLADAASLYPRAWLEKSNAAGYLAVQKVDRGYYSGSGRGGTIALSGPPGGGSRDTAIHEFGHRFEDVIPEAGPLARSFYNRRVGAQKPRPLGPGYDKDEITRPDRFYDPYVGKVYKGRPPPTEVLSMGFDGTLGRRYASKIRSDDPDHYHFMLGLLAGL